MKAKKSLMLYQSSFCTSKLFAFSGPIFHNQCLVEPRDLTLSLVVGVS